MEAKDAKTLYKKNCQTVIKKNFPTLTTLDVWIQTGSKMLKESPMAAFSSMFYGFLKPYTVPSI